MAEITLVLNFSADEFKDNVLQPFERGNYEIMEYVKELLEDITDKLAEAES